MMDDGEKIKFIKLATLSPNLKDFVTDQNRLSIGRSLDNDIVIAHINISRIHCKLVKKDDNWIIIDSSSFGTYVNKNKIEKNLEYTLKNEDIINLGPLDVNLCYKFCTSKTIKRKSPSNTSNQVTNSDSSSAKKIKINVSQEAGPSNNSKNTSIDNIEEKLLKDNEELKKKDKELKEILEKLQSIESKNLELKKELTEKQKEKADELEKVQQKLGNLETLMDEECQCSICSEMFIEANVLNCGHTFCGFCINEWKNKHKNRECPICRTKITSQMRSYLIDNVINNAIKNLSEDLINRRNEAIEERKKIILDIEAKKASKKSKKKNTKSSNIRNARSNPPNRGLVTVINLDSDDSEDEAHSLSSYSTSIYSDNPDYFSDSDVEIPGDESAFYGGYGYCFRCGARGHWANGCPLRRI